MSKSLVIVHTYHLYLAHTVAELCGITLLSQHDYQSSHISTLIKPFLSYATVGFAPKSK